MVKAVQAEESISAYFDGLLKNRGEAEVGLLVGKASVGSRDIALAVIPTKPEHEGEQVLTINSGSSSSTKPKKAAGPKVKANEPAISIGLDTEWIVAHALQVSKMLPGGLSVLGLYLFAPESGYSSASRELCSTLASIAADISARPSSPYSAAAAAAVAAAVTATTAAAGGACAPQELLLLHVDSSSRKFTMRSCHVSSAATVSSTLKPCELKFGSSLSSIVCLRCTHTFDISLPVSASEATMQQLLQDAVAVEDVRVLSAVAAVEGRTPSSSSQPLADLLPSSTSSSTSEAASVQLYCLPHAATALQAPKAAAGSTGASTTSSCIGSSRLHGSVEAVAYVHKRDPVSKALLELKNDVTNSLAARLQLLADEALDAANEAADQQGTAAGASGGASGSTTTVSAHPLLLPAAAAAKRVRLELARRVLLPWSSLNLQVCDYLAVGEGPDAAVERAHQLMQLLTLQPNQVLELEGPALQKKQQVVAGTAVAQQGAAGRASSCSAAVLAGAAAGLVAAAAVGIGYLNLGQ